MIAIVDYGMGNVRSVQNAIEYLGEEAVVTARDEELAAADRLILPGVGAFGDAMANIEARGLVPLLKREVIERKKPFLGICLGLQLVANSSTEHRPHAGLGWFDAEVLRFDMPDDKLKIPHMGWNEIEPCAPHALLAGLKPTQLVFYFVHSFHIVLKNPREAAATCTYGYPFTAAIARDNIFATQFHPEKSQDSGLQILKNFAAWNPA
jgi:imidazole glycerol-phosphate synthase subunit HisH